MSRISVLLIGALIVVFVFAAPVKATEGTSKFGLGFSVVQESPNIVIRYVNYINRIEANIAFSHLSLKEYGNSTRIIYGFGGTTELKQSSEVRPYLGIRFNFDRLSLEDKAYTDFLLNFVFGAAYSISKKFSIEGEFRINLINSDAGYSPNVSIPDATVVSTSQMVSIYFYF